MTTRNTASLPILAVKSVLARVVGEISMRTLTAAIRQHCLQAAQSGSKDQLLAFFLACESRLKRSTQQEWNRVIDNEIRRMVGLELLAKFVTTRICSMVIGRLRDAPIGVLQGLEEELGEMEISEEVHLKTKYFCQWLQFLQERREIKRLKNKEVEDLKKSRLFCQYSLKFQAFIQWKQHTRKANTDRAKAKQIQLAVIKRTAAAAFLAFREKIDILGIQSQLAEAVSAKLRQLEVRSVFGKLKKNQEKQLSLASKAKNGNIWLFRFYRFITNRCTPLHNLSSTRARETHQKNYHKLIVQLCWKGIKQQVKQTNAQIKNIHMTRRNRAVIQFKKIQSHQKTLKKNIVQLMVLRKSRFFRQLMENVDASSQTSLQYCEKINAVHLIKTQSVVRQFLSLLKKKCETEKQTKKCIDAFCDESSKLKKKSVFHNLSSFRGKRGEISSKQDKVLSLVSFKLFLFRYQQYHSHKTAEIELHHSLSKHHNTHLLSLVFKSFSLYRTVTLNHNEALSNILSSLRLKRLGEVLQVMRERNELAGRLQRLVMKSEWVALKFSFVTILNRMLSNKMRIKAFNRQQEDKLKSKLLELLKRNSNFMLTQREAIGQVALSFAKRRLVRNLTQEVAKKRAEEEVECLSEHCNKQRFFRAIKQGITRKNQIYLKGQQVKAMLAGNRMIDFISSARQFLQYRQTEARLTFKFQKALVKGVLKTFRKRVAISRQQKDDRQDLSKQHEAKIRFIQSERAGKYLIGLLRSKPSTLMEKSTKVKQIRVKHVLNILETYHKTSLIRKGRQTSNKIQFLGLLQTKFNLIKSQQKFCKKINRQKLKSSMVLFQQNTLQQSEQRYQKSQQLAQWLQQSRSLASKQSLISRLNNRYDLKENSLILINTILRNHFQRLIKYHLANRASTIKDLIAMRLYATNLKRRALRGLRRATDVEVLKENRNRTELYSKLSGQKSMEHVRKRSKLLETIERYNHSRISRVVR